MKQLIIIDGRDKGRCIAIDDGDALSIGRGDGSSLQLHDLAVSRLHCHLNLNDDELSVCDAGSRWGTFVNGQRVTQQTLRDGDRLLVGETEFLVVDAAQDGSTRFPKLAKTLPPTTPAEAASQQPLQQPLQPAAFSRLKDNKPGEPRICDDDDVMRLVDQQYLCYDVRAIIATARTGAVFLAHDTDHDRDVALKIFWPRLFGEDNERARFVRSMRTAIPICHPNIVRVLTAGRHRGVCYTSSEIVEGESVASLISRIGVCGMLDWRRVLRIAIDIGRALVAADQHKVVHRNITPHNLLIRTQDDAVKLNDLVLAKAVAGTRMEQISSPGEVLGDLLYMSPEQLIADRPIDCRSDIYSLGASIYTMLTARPPIEGRNTRETMQMIEVETPRPPTTYHLSISPLFEGEVMRMLEKRPEDRHSSPQLLVNDLVRVAVYENLPIGEANA